MERTVQEKYIELLELMGIMFFHPFQNNYYASFAGFGDSISSDIEKDIEKHFKSSKQYKELLKIAEFRKAE